MKSGLLRTSSKEKLYRKKRKQNKERQKTRKGAISEEV
jgi:hypothetical protein